MIDLTVDLISNLHIGLSDLVNPLILMACILDDTINPLGLTFPVSQAVGSQISLRKDMFWHCLYLELILTPLALQITF